MSQAPPLSGGTLAEAVRARSFQLYSVVLTRFSAARSEDSPSTRIPSVVVVGKWGYWIAGAPWSKTVVVCWRAAEEI